MKITQISVFLENKAGRLFDATQLMAENGINIRALTIAESEDFGVLRMVVDKPADTIALLKANAFVATMTEIIAVEVPDVPGGLCKVLNVLQDGGINVEYMYGFVEKTQDKALMVFRFDDIDGAIDVLEKGNIGILTTNDIEKL